MSIFIESKSPNQCRSHHQKMMAKFHSIEKIISQLIPKNQDTNPSEDKIKSKKSTKESKIEEINSTLEKKQN